MSKNKANFKRLETIPTWKIKEILEEHSYRGIDGRDYGPVKEELEAILFYRQEKAAFEANKKTIAQWNERPIFESAMSLAIKAYEELRLKEVFEHGIYTDDKTLKA